MQFINPVLANETIFSLSVLANKNFTDGITFRLYDYADMSISISMTFFPTEGFRQSQVAINGVMQGKAAGSFNDGTTLMGFRYLQVSKALVGTDGSIFGFPTTTEKGESFNGFPSGKVWIEFDCGNVYGEGLELLLKTVNNANLSKISNDNVRPQVSFMGNIPSYIEINSTYKIPKVVAQDVFSSYTKISMTIKCGTEVVRTIDDYTNEDIQFTFEKSGKYTISYKVEDSALDNGIAKKNNTVSPFINVWIVEYENPTIQYSNSFIESAKLNDTYKLPEVTAQDNETLKPTVLVFVIRPNYEMYEIMDGEIKFTELGKYTIRYLVFDDNYNYVMEDHVIIVE